MTFNSLVFICWFLPFFLGLYYLAPERLRNYIIFLFGIIFYTYGSLEHPENIALFGGFVFVNFSMALLISRLKRGKHFLYVFSVLLNLILLFGFKYILHFGPIISDSFSMQIALPLGISFYCFQAISYLSDVYHERCVAEEKFIHFANYMSFFPQVLSGPIVRYKDVRPYLRERRVTKENILKGVECFVLGLAVKTILASRLGGMWSNIQAIGYESISTPLAWLGLIAFSLELYFDFYGYSLMALGLGELIGFPIPENFLYPYMSVSMSEFWRRWHVTLGNWFRDYVYIPLGGNRKGSFRTTINLFLVWLFTGLWHGSSLNFLIWSGLIFLIIVIEKFGIGNFLKEHKAIGHIYMLILIPITWMIFAIPDLQELRVYAGRLIGFGGVNVYGEDYLKYLGNYGVFMVTGLVCSTMYPRKLFQKIKNGIVRYGLLGILLLICIYLIYQGMNDPFMYFQF